MGTGIGGNKGINFGEVKSTQKKKKGKRGLNNFDSW